MLHVVKLSRLLAFCSPIARLSILPSAQHQKGAKPSGLYQSPSIQFQSKKSEEKVLPAGQRCQGCLEDPEGQGCPGREKLIKKSRGSMSLPPKPAPPHLIPSLAPSHPHFCCSFCFYIICSFFYMPSARSSPE